MINVLISGGSGTRMWPLSTKNLPKQFYPLIEGKSLFEITVERNLKVCDDALIVTNKMHHSLAEKVTDQSLSFMLEPMGRDTLPAIVLASMAVNPDELILVTPADHIVADEQAYGRAVKKATELAEEGFLLTFGIKPLYAETGYGYIEADGNDVNSFREKPAKDVAEVYLKSGRHFWNSGIFCFKAGTLLQETKKHAPEVYQACVNTFEASSKSEGIIYLNKEEMARIPAISIDYGLMEKSDLVKMVPADMAWTDLGSFDALYDYLQKDESGTHCSSKILPIESNGNLMLSSKKLVATIGIQDIICIETEDVILLCKRGQSQQVKQLTNSLKEEKSELI